MSGDPFSFSNEGGPSSDDDFLVQAAEIANTSRSLERSEEARRAWHAMRPELTTDRLRILLSALDAEMSEARSWAEFGGRSPELSHTVRRVIEEETILAIARINKIRLEVLDAISARGEQSYPEPSRRHVDKNPEVGGRRISPSLEQLRHGRKVEEARRHSAYLDEIGRYGWTVGNGLPASYQFFRRRNRKGRG